MNEADWNYFQSELDRAVVTILGRLSHEYNPNTRGRTRLILSNSVYGIEDRHDGFWWNPETCTLVDALKIAAPGGGRVAVPGGRDVFDLFLDIGFDAFHLSRIANVRIPNGRTVFTDVEKGLSADELLAGTGLKPGPEQVLDRKPQTILTIWTR